MWERRRGLWILQQDHSWNWTFGYHLSIWPLNIRFVTVLYQCIGYISLLMISTLGYTPLQKCRLCSCVLGDLSQSGYDKTRTCQTEKHNSDNHSLLVGQSLRQVLSGKYIFSRVPNRPCSLIATIKKAAPHLLAEMMQTAPPIPDVMPPNFLDKYRKNNIEGIGEPTTACFLTESNMDPTDWYLKLLYLSPLCTSPSNTTQVDVWEIWRNTSVLEPLHSSVLFTARELIPNPASNRRYHAHWYLSRRRILVWILFTLKQHASWSSNILQVWTR